MWYHIYGDFLRRKSPACLFLPESQNRIRAEMTGVPYETGSSRRIIRRDTIR